MKTFYVENLFLEKDFKDLRDYVFNHINSSTDFNYTKYYGRYWNTITFNDYLHNKILDVAKNNFKVDNLEIVYTQCVKYQINDGVIPSLGNHVDDFYATHTLNIVIDTTINWPLTVEGIDFPCIPNSAIFLKGDEDFHERPKYPSYDENDYLVSLFVNFAPSDSELIKKVKAFRDLPESQKKIMKMKMTPNDVNLF